MCARLVGYKRGTAVPDSEWVKVDVVCAIAGDHVICAATIDDKLRARS